MAEKHIAAVLCQQLELKDVVEFICNVSLSWLKLLATEWAPYTACSVVVEKDSYFWQSVTGNYAKEGKDTLENPTHPIK